MVISVTSSSRLVAALLIRIMTILPASFPSGPVCTWGLMPWSHSTIFPATACGPDVPARHSDGWSRVLIMAAQINERMLPLWWEMTLILLERHTDQAHPFSQPNSSREVSVLVGRVSCLYHQARVRGPVSRMPMMKSWSEKVLAKCCCFHRGQYRDLGDHLMMEHFTLEKIRNTDFSLDSSKASRTDGFSSFFQKYWNLIKGILREDFYKGDLGLTRFNFAFTSLIPEKGGLLTSHQSGYETDQSPEWFIQNHLKGFSS